MAWIFKVMAWNFTVRRRDALTPSLLIPAATFALLAGAPAYRVATSGQTAPPVPSSVEVASAQEWSGEIPAHISVVDGQVTLEREGRAQPAETNLILLAGDRLRTARSRAEVLFADGSSLALDDYTTIDLLDSSLMRLVVGRTRLQIARATGDLEYRVDSVSGSALIRTPGDYRLTLDDARGVSNPEFELAVLRGTAELVNDRGRTIVRAGARAVAVADAAPSPAYAFNVALNDSFDRWAMDQRQARMGYQSQQYLPAELTTYSGDFDRYGSWEYSQPYGYVWYPVVPVGWRPYSAGRWSFAASFGWFWIGHDHWSWPTHHYGRWGYHGSRWYWIPGRHWGPAWVSWASAPGYIGWCPLGFDNRPVFSFTYISGGSRAYGYRGYDHWNGWTVLPARSFTPGVAVPRHAVPGRTLSADVANRFAVRTAPDRPATGFSRGAALGSPGSRNWVPRSATAATSTRSNPGSRAFDNRGGSLGTAAPRTGASLTTPNPRAEIGARATSGVESPSRLGPGTVRDPVSRGFAVPRTNGTARMPSPQPRATVPEQPRADAPATSRSAPWNRPETIVGGRRTETPPESPSRAVPRSSAGTIDSRSQRSWTPPETISGRAPQREPAPPNEPPVFRGGSRQATTPAPESRGYRPAPANRGDAPSRSIAAPRSARPDPGRTSAPPQRSGTSSGGSSPARTSPGQSRQAPPSSGGGSGRAAPRGGRGGGSR